MRQFIVATCAFVLIGVVASCSAMSSAPAGNVNRSASLPSPAATTAKPVKRAALKPIATRTTAVTKTPTVPTTPTITPTPGPPTLTPTPAPGDATLSAAEDVDQALVAFAQAAAQGDSQATLKAQQKLLDAASAAAPIAEVDQTNYGRQLRSALDAVQAATAGSYDKASDAHKALLQITGGAVVGANATPIAVLPRPANQTQRSLPDVAQNLQKALHAYNQATGNGNQDDLLRTQRDLLSAVSVADAVTKNNQSPLAQQIKAALTAIHDGLNGDTGKFRDAENDLGNLSSAQNATPSPTVSPSPTISPTATVSPTASPTPSVTPTASATVVPSATARSP